MTITARNGPNTIKIRFGQRLAQLRVKLVSKALRGENPAESRSAAQSDGRTWASRSSKSTVHDLASLSTVPRPKKLAFLRHYIVVRAASCCLSLWEANSMTERPPRSNWHCLVTYPLGLHCGARLCKEEHGTIQPSQHESAQAGPCRKSLFAKKPLYLREITDSRASDLKNRHICVSI